MRLDSVRDVAIVTSCSILMFSNSALGAVVMLRAGHPAGPNVLFEIDRAKNPKQIGLKTEQAGVAGSVINVFIDREQNAVLHHIFADNECKFVEQQSRCELRLSAGSREFIALVYGFMKGRNAKVTVADAGVMKMDQSVSLKGVARLLGR
jgi:hypothetical protein